MSSRGRIPSAWEPMSLYWVVELYCEVRNLPQMFVLMRMCMWAQADWIKACWLHDTLLYSDSFGSRNFKLPMKFAYFVALIVNYRANHCFKRSIKTANKPLE